LIATLEKELTAVQGKIGKKESELNSLKDQQGKLVSEAEQFKAQVKTLEKKIGGLKLNLEETKATAPADA